MSNGGYTGDPTTTKPTEEYYRQQRFKAHFNKPGWDTKAIGVYANQDYLNAMKRWGEGAGARRETEWQESGLGETYSKLGEATEAELMRAYNRQIGQMRGRLGFAASSGAGGGAGYWDSAKIALEGRAMGQLGEAATASERIEAGARADWINKEDAQQFQMEQQSRQAQYRMAELNRQAELNDSSWWEDFGGIIGSIAAIPMTGGMSLAGYGVQSAVSALR